jgi:hypothetical protein
MLQPSDSSAPAMARPMPRLPPVTTATFPCKRDPDDDFEEPFSAAIG